jgi:hypothetical protein
VKIPVIREKYREILRFSRVPVVFYPVKTSTFVIFNCDVRKRNRELKFRITSLTGKDREFQSVFEFVTNQPHDSAGVPMSSDVSCTPSPI